MGIVGVWAGGREGESDLLSATAANNQEFHYVRTLGADGGVAACQGPAIGLDLETLLKNGLPPWKVALELVAGLCEVLDIADEDGEVHGDVSARYVFVDDTGAVSVEGFGVRRSKTRAPEGSPRGAPTDLYGLGTVAYRLFCSTPLPNFTSDDPDTHDDAVIDAILQIDLSGVNEELQGDLQWYIAKLMAFDREDRPTAVEVWRSFIAFADAVPGPDFAKWCSAAVEGRGERRKDIKRDAVPDEDLGGPVRQSGPLAAGAIAFGESAAKGQATAFWSKDAMKAALERENVEDKAYRPAVGGSTEFWSKDQRQAMAAGTSEAPRPKRTTGDNRSTVFTRPTGDADTARMDGPASPPRSQSVPLEPMKPPPPMHGSGPARTGELQIPREPVPAPDLTYQGKAVTPAAPPPAPLPPVAVPPPAVQQRAPVAVQAPPPSQARPAADSYRPEPSEPPSGSMRTYAIVGGVAVVLLLTLACMGLGGTGAAFAWWQSTAGIAVAPAPAPVPVVVPAPEPEPVPAEVVPPTPGKAPPKPKPSTAPTPKPSTSPTPKPSVTPKPTPSPAPTPDPAPAPKPGSSVRPGGNTNKPAPVDPNAPVVVAFKSQGRGSVTCSGKKTSFDGSTSVSLEGYQLPVPCLVNIDGAKGVFQVYASGSVSCDKVGTDVSCTPAQVR